MRETVYQAITAEM